MRELLPDLDALTAAGHRVGRAVVISVWGSAPRPPGACLLATTAGRLAGSVSGGCVETAVAGEIASAIQRGTGKLISYGVTDERAWEVGLACGGTIQILVEPSLPDEVLRAARAEVGSVVGTVLPAAGGVADAEPARVVVNEAGNYLGPVSLTGVRDLAREALRRETSTVASVPVPGGPEVRVFLEVFPRRPTLVVFGGVHIAVALIPLARQLGYRTVVADGRQAFVTRERFPEADQLLCAWPDEAFRQVGLGSATYVCVLSHDPKFDEPALELALRSPAPYIGAIGSRKTQGARRERLRARGFSAADLERLHGPIGLDLGGRGPAETALAILAEMTMVRYGGSGRPQAPGYMAASSAVGP
jgi:xanthine dehydrogenase accessory factor